MNKLRKRRVIALIMSVIMIVSICTDALPVKADEVTEPNTTEAAADETATPEVTVTADAEEPAVSEVVESVLPSETTQPLPENVDGVYIITEPAQFEFVRSNPEESYRLGNDIDFSGQTMEPIGSLDVPFTGTFDGGGFTISNLSVETENDYAGLFGVIKNASIQHLTLKGVSIKGKNYVGAFAGYITGDNKNITDCKALEGSVSGQDFVGGLAGATDEQSTVSNTVIQECQSEVTVTATGNKTGGVIGCLKGGIYACSSTGDVTGNDCVGGIAGQSSGGTVEACYTKGSLTGSVYTGGLIGVMNGGTIEQCYSLKTVQGSSYVGGLIGQSSGGIVENCYVIGKVTGNSYVGGLIGQCTTITYLTNCYVSALTLANDSTLGGLCSKEDNLEIRNSFFDISVSELDVQATSSTGRQTAQMRKQATFEGWNFTSVWSLDEDTSYPYLMKLPKPEEIAGPPIEEDMQGEGTQESPFIVKSKKQLLSIANNLSAYYILGADINLGGAEWEPIGTTAAPFTGSLCGNGFTISNFQISKSDVNYVGFFGVVSDAIIKNITFDRGIIIGKSYVGTVSGCVQGTNTAIEQITVSNGSVSGTSYIGGLFGTVNQASANSIAYCKVNAAVSASGERAGGIAGNFNGTLTRCLAAGTVAGTNNIGGLTGYCNGTVTLTESYSKAEVNATGKNAGGLTGYITKGNITNCFTIGNVNGSSIIGGILGAAAGAVIISSCYSATKLSGALASTGGIAGSVSNLTISSSYYDGTLNGLVSSSAIQVSKATAAMKRKGTYTDWDFDTIWNIEEGITYPYLRSIDKPDGIDSQGGEVQDGQQGTGTAEDPYIIQTADDLNRIRYELSACYKLAANIDLGGIEWSPIGTSTVPFTGVLDGNGCEISNFQITQSTANYIGLFGVVSNAEIKNITIKDAVITGKNYVGALAGSVNGTGSSLSNCHVAGGYVTGVSYIGGLAGQTNAISTYTVSGCSASAEVIGTGSDIGGLFGLLYGDITLCYTAGKVNGVTNVGGIIGYHASASSITKCYSVSSVTGTTVAAGIVGYKYQKGTITNCYVLGTVNGTNNVGGMIGVANAAVSLEYCYAAAMISAVNGTAGGLSGSASNITVVSSVYDGLLSGLAPANAVQISKITDSMMRKEAYIGWDFETTWAIDEGKGYPYLKELTVPSESVNIPSSLMEEGTGTAENPYVIRTAKQLQAVQYEITAHYKLANDIDLAGTEWTPVGSSTSPFAGGFDGNGYTISNFTISKGTIDNIGFFGVVGSAEIENLTVSGFHIYGKSYVGGLIGKTITDDRIIKNCHADDGRVCGTSYIGGLIGFVAKAGTTDIEQCSSNSEVIGTDNYTGNLVGYLYGGMKHCYAEGTVEGDTYVGGLAGYCNTGNISECYAVVRATDGTYVGGITGYKTSGTIENCFTVGSIIGTNQIGGIIGNVSGTTYITNCYSSVSIKTSGTTLGGLCSSNTNIVMSNCFYDGMVSTITPKTKYDCSYLTGSLIKKATYTNWDFDSVWEMEEGASYPYLRAMEKPEEVKVELKDFPEGSGTAESPYVLKTAEQLNLVKYELSASYELGCDIDLKESEWESIGNNTNAPFTGKFNGNGHIISNFSISKSTTNCIGFFGAVSEGELSSINLENARVTGKNYVGALAGYVTGTAWKINDCHISDVRIAGVGCIGGLAGYVVKASEEGIKNSTTKVEVIGTGDKIGGLAGSLAGNITASYTVSNIQGANYVGGIAGYSEAGVIEKSYVTGDIIGGTRTAGLVGYKTSGTIQNCYDLGTVTGTSYVSGIIGAVSSTKVYVTNCYTAAVITGTGSYVGGIYGTKGSIVAVSSYYNRTVNPNLTVVEDSARYTSGLKRRANFTDWDFDSIWSIREYKTYPSLQGLDVPEQIVGPAAEDLPEGSGTKEDPYIIKTKQQLVSMKYNLTAYYEIVNDIDLEGMEWEPLGSFETPFTGNLNGNGFTVSNFVINAEQTDYIGFFRVVSDASVSNLKLKDIQFNGGQYVGGFAGLALGENAKFTQCYVTGGSISGSSYVGGLIGKFEGGTQTGIIECSSSVTVKASLDYAGGLAGWLSSKVENSYSEGDVTGINDAGGLIGYVKTAVVINCFALGNVEGTEYIGGILGSCEEKAEITKSYFAGKLTAAGVSSGGICGITTNVVIVSCYYDGIVSALEPKTESDPSRLTNGMKVSDNFVSWNFTSTWTINEKTSYPYLRSMSKPEKVDGVAVEDAPQGAGTKENPYMILTVNQLINIKYELSAYYKLGADIDLAEIDWTPLGRLDLPFTGHFDGNGFTIRNLKIQKSTSEYMGLFGVIRNATIINVTISTVTIEAAQYAGGLIGFASGESVYIYNCHVEGNTISGTKYIGGLIGKMECSGKGQVINCSTNVEITSTGDYAGGLIGYVDGIVLKCYTTGKITGITYIGGIAGYALNTNIEKCYSTGIVAASSYVAGIIGYSWNCTIHYCYVLGTVSGVDYVAGIIGVSGYSSTIVECYVACKIIVTGSIVGGLCSTEEFITVTRSFYDGLATGIIPRLSIDYCKLGGVSYKLTYSEWDFTSIWTIEEGISYPYLSELPKPDMASSVITAGRPEGRGIEGDPYKIASANELGNLKYESDCYFELKNNIDLEGAEWIPVGDTVKPFQGTFNGNGYTISNFVINCPGQNNIGFFGAATGGVIKNLKLSNGQVTGAQKVGALIGLAEKNTFVDNCSIDNVSVTGDIYVGTLIGYLNGKAAGCSTAGKVNGTTYVGGVVGYGKEAIMEECLSMEDVDGKYYVGGIIGYSFLSSLQNCETISTVTATNYTGGIAGYSNTGTIEECQSFATVTGKSYVGGIVGYNNGATLEVCKKLADTDGDVLPLIKQYNESAVLELSDSFATVNGSTYVGGIIGYAYGGNAVSCTSDGSVAGRIYVGGLIGYSVGSVTEDCTNSSAVTGTRYVDELIGYSKA